MSVSILHVKVLCLRQLCDFHQLCIVHSLIHERLSEDLAICTGTVSVLDQVEKGLPLFIIQAAHALHKFFKFLLCIFVCLKLSS